MLIHSLAGLPAFAAYFAAAVALCVLYLFVYTRATPHQEYDLIIHEHNASAALALGMSLIGFSIALASAIIHATTIFDFIVWGIVAIIVQIGAYYLARLGHPDISNAIRQNALASAVWLGAVSIVAGILSAACMSP
jgi:putative membrane protein